MFLKNTLKSLFVLTFMLAFTSVSAQFNLDEFENIQKLKKVPLLVILESPNPKKIARLEKKNPEALKKYIATIEGKNNAIITSIKKDWKISKDVRFIDKDALKIFQTRENKGKYAYFTSKVFNKLKWKKSETGYLAYTDYSIRLIGDPSPIAEKRFSTEYNPESIITSKDVKLVLNEIQGQFTTKELQVAKRMAKKTLKIETRLAKNTFSDDE